MGLWISRTEISHRERVETDAKVRECARESHLMLQEEPRWRRWQLQEERSRQADKSRGIQDISSCAELAHGHEGSIFDLPDFTRRSGSLENLDNYLHAIQVFKDAEGRDRVNQYAKEGIYDDRR